MPYNDRINIGCGMRPTPGWINYDNSPSVTLARHPWLHRAMRKAGMIDHRQNAFIEFCQTNDLRRANALNRLPHQDGTVAVVYSCHVLEHFDRKEAALFLNEVRRVLRPGGILRLAVPNLRFHIENYNRDKDADSFMRSIGITLEKPRGIKKLLRFLIAGDREHHNMYDDGSLPKLLREHGFENPVVLQPGETTIVDPGKLNLAERAPESLFVEARKPQL